MVYLLSMDNQARYLTDIFLKSEEKDTIMKRIELPWNSPLGDLKHMEDYEGLFFVCDDGEILLGQWCEQSIDVDNIRIESKNITDKSVQQGEDIGKEHKDIPKEELVEEIEAAPTSEADAVEQTMKAAYEEAESRDYMKVCQEMLDTYPKLPLFPDSQFLECVKIIPHDIGKLAMGNWKLGTNSFLSHGYYHYRYLMLGKVKFEKKEAYVIGVPGVFTNKERYLANMFGFSVFVPVKRTKVLTGNFGYWVLEVLRE